MKDRPTFFPKGDCLNLSLLAGMVLWFNHEMLGTAQVPFFRDLGPFFYPMRFSLMQSLKAWELPLWDRHMAMGFPLLANFQSEAFYVPNFFLLLLPFFTAVQAIFIFHYLIAATGSYKLLRQWDYPPYLCLIGAILFTFGGATVSLSNLLNHFQAAVWVPWVLLWWERWIRLGSRSSLIAATFLSLTQFLAGSPEIYVMTIGVLVLDGLRLKAEGEGITYRKFLIRFLLMQALVLGLAMVQILPTLELFSQSRGRTVISSAEGLRWSLHPLSLLNLFFLDKEVDLNRLDGLRLFFSPEIPLLISLYLGAITLFGICLWSVKFARKEKGILLVLVAVSIALAMGDNTPIYPFLFRHIFFLDLIRFPEKFFFLTYALFLFIALRGLQIFLLSEHHLLRRHGLVFLLIPLLFLSIYFLFQHERVGLIRFITARKAISPLQSWGLESSSLILVNLERQIALSSGISLLFFLWKKEKVRESFAQILLVALVFFDLYSAHRPYQYFLDAGSVTQTARALDKPESYRLMYIPGPKHLHPDFYPSIKKSFGEGVATVYANLLPNTGLFYGFDYLQELDALRRWPYDVFIQKAANLPAERLYRLLGALNVKYITTFEPLPPAKGITLVRSFTEHGSHVYKVDGVVPRVYVVASATEGKNGWEILDRLSGETFDPLKSVVLDRPLFIRPQERFQGQAEIVDYKNNNVTIRASLNGPGILVLADSFYPGWKAYVDGKETEILPADFLFRAVPLSRGEHMVIFRYQPRSFAIGLSLSLVTLAGLILWPAGISLLRR